MVYSMCETHTGELFWLRKMMMWIYGKWVEDTLDFYLFLGRLCKVPVIGRAVRFFAGIYGRYYHGGHAATVEECLEILGTARQIGVADCACRVKHHNCNAPVRTCITVNTGVDVFGPLKNQEIISLDQAAEIMKQSFELGLIRAFHHCISPNTYVICNCCTCCCVPHRLRTEFGIKAAIENGAMVAAINSDRCARCGQCLKVCPQKAIDITDSLIDEMECLGCGLCTGACSSGAIRMAERMVETKIAKPGKGERAIMYITFLIVILPLALIHKVFNKVANTVPRSSTG